MAEVTNEELLRVVKENFTNVLQETGDIYKQNEKILDELRPSYTNIREMYGMLKELSQEVKKLRSQVATLQAEVQSFRRQGGK